MPIASVRARKGVRRPAALGLALGVVLLASACHRRRPRTLPQPTPPKPSTAPRPGRPAVPPHITQGEQGIASWYGHPFHGRRTASGEVYNMYARTAAHRTLPFGTRVRVHDLENGQNVVVRITDRGPFVEGRIIDLSYAAAQAMQMPGIARVRLEILGYGDTGSPAPSPGIFAVQVGAFRDQANAQRLKDQIPSSFGPVTIQTLERDDGVFYRVRVGSVSTEEEAERLAAKLRAANYASETFIVRIN